MCSKSRFAINCMGTDYARCRSGMIEYFLSEMLMFEKPKATELVKHVTPFSCDAGFTFQIYCRYCTDSGRTSGNRRDRANQKVLLKVAEKFITAGWRLDDNVTVCPVCVRKRSRQ